MWPMRVAFMVELLAAEMLFLWPAEKRSRFPLRYGLSAAACLLAAPVFSLGDWAGQLGQFILFTSLFLVSTAAMGFCFHLKAYAVVSSCAAGYAVQHIAYHFTKITAQYGFLEGVRFGVLTEITVREVVVLSCVYLLFGLTVCMYSAKNQCWKNKDRSFNVLSMGIIFICVGLTRVSISLGDSNSTTVSIYAIAALLMALTVQLVLSKVVELRYLNATVNLLLQKEKQHYEQSKKAIDTINIKYHDLKHMLGAMHLPPEEIDTIRKAVQIYGSQVKTGNEALDILLTENTLRLEEEGITLTYMGNGEHFSFMPITDVYSLFGNAVNNAVEAVREVEDPEKRIINIVTERKGALINIGITNYYMGAISFDGGLPVTTKSDDQGFHGFGMRSMKLIAEKYGGGLSVTADGEVFDLGIYLMRSATVK